MLAWSRFQSCAPDSASEERNRQQFTALVSQEIEGSELFMMGMYPMRCLPIPTDRMPVPLRGTQNMVKWSGYKQMFAIR